MELLTEADKNTIKRNIGDAFRKILRLAELKIILRKKVRDRSERDFDKLVHFLEGFDYLKNQKQLGYIEMRELAQALTYK